MLPLISAVSCGDESYNTNSPSTSAMTVVLTQSKAYPLTNIYMYSYHCQVLVLSFSLQNTWRWRRGKNWDDEHLSHEWQRTKKENRGWGTKPDCVACTYLSSKYNHDINYCYKRQITYDNHKNHKNHIQKMRVLLWRSCGDNVLWSEWVNLDEK